MRTRKPYGSWEELHDSLQYGRKSITNRSYLQCTLCSEGNIDDYAISTHSIGLRPSNVFSVNDAGFYVLTPRANNHRAIANAWVVNMILENIGFRWAPIGTGPQRDYMGVARKSLPYPSTKFDRAACSGDGHSVHIAWDGTVKTYDGRKGWVEAFDESRKRYPNKSEANKLANYHARILGFPSTSRLWGYKMPAKLTTDQAIEMAKTARKLDYTNVANAWERGCYITWDSVFGAKVPELMHKYNMELAKQDGNRVHRKNPLMKIPKNSYYERMIKNRTM